MAKKDSKPEAQREQRKDETDNTTATLGTSEDAARLAVDLDGNRPVAVPDDAARLDVLRDGNLEGLEKEAAKVAPDGIGELKDNLGKDIARHDGPGIGDMYKEGKKHDVTNDNDPFAGQPTIDRGGKDAPDMPLKDDPSWAMDENLKALVGLGGDDKKKFTPMDGSQHKQAQDPGVKDTKGTTFEDWKKKQNPDAGTKYVDPDQVDTTQVEKPAEPPPNAHDLLGHRTNPLDDAGPEVDDNQVAEVIAAHKGLDPSQILTNPEDLPEAKPEFDPANPPRLEGEELKNTGNPNDPFAPPPPPGPTVGPGGEQPHTDGDGGKQSGPTVFGTPGGGDKVGGFTTSPVGGDATEGGGTISPPAVGAPAPDAATLDVPAVASAETGTDFAGSPPGMEDAAAPGGSDYDDDLAEGGPFPDDG